MRKTEPAGSTSAARWARLAATGADGSSATLRRVMPATIDRYDVRRLVSRLTLSIKRRTALAGGPKTVGRSQGASGPAASRVGSSSSVPPPIDQVAGPALSSTRHDPLLSISIHGVTLRVPLGMHLEISAPELNQLYVWLRDEDELRGRLSLAGPPPRAGELGSAVDVLLVSLAPGGVAGALVAGLFSW